MGTTDMLLIELDRNTDQQALRQQLPLDHGQQVYEVDRYMMVIPPMAPRFTLTLLDTNEQLDTEDDVISYDMRNFLESHPRVLKYEVCPKYKWHRVRFSAAQVIFEWTEAEIETLDRTATGQRIADMIARELPGASVVVHWDDVNDTFDGFFASDMRQEVFNMPWYDGHVWGVFRPEEELKAENTAAVQRLAQLAQQGNAESESELQKLEDLLERRLGKHLHDTIARLGFLARNGGTEDPEDATAYDDSLQELSAALKGENLLVAEARTAVAELVKAAREGVNSEADHKALQRHCNLIIRRYGLMDEPQRLMIYARRGGVETETDLTVVNNCAELLEQVISGEPDANEPELNETAMENLRDRENLS